MRGDSSIGPPFTRSTRFRSSATSHSIPPSTNTSFKGFLSSRLAVALFAVFTTIFVSHLLSSLSAPSIAHNSGGGAGGATTIRSYDLTPILASPEGYRSQQKLLILTPLKNAAPYLDEYFRSLSRLRYPKNLVSLAFLVSDSTDQTLSTLQKQAATLATVKDKAGRYDTITILQKDFKFNLAEDARHGFEGQPVRRAFIARARNYLVTAALQPDHAWVLWLDVDVVRYDPDIIMDLMSVDKDIVVPNTLWHQKDNWDFWGFDRNNFAETEQSLALLAKLGPEVLLVEGYRELVTHRYHLVDMPTHLGLAHVPLDGIGCTFTLVKAHVHREGVMFPTFVFDNQVETEGFAKVAKKAGFEVVGIPGIVVFHAQND